MDVLPIDNSAMAPSRLLDQDHGQQQQQPQQNHLHHSQHRHSLKSHASSFNPSFNSPNLVFAFSDSSSASLACQNPFPSDAPAGPGMKEAAALPTPAAQAAAQAAGPSSSLSLLVQHEPQHLHANPQIFSTNTAPPPQAKVAAAQAAGPIPATALGNPSLPGAQAFPSRQQLAYQTTAAAPSSTTNSVVPKALPLNASLRANIWSPVISGGDFKRRHQPKFSAFTPSSHSTSFSSISSATSSQIPFPLSLNSNDASALALPDGGVSNILEGLPASSTTPDLSGSSTLETNDPGPTVVDHQLEIEKLKRELALARSKIGMMESEFAPYKMNHNLSESTIGTTDTVTQPVYKASEMPVLNDASAPMGLPIASQQPYYMTQGPHQAAFSHIEGSNMGPVQPAPRLITNPPPAAAFPDPITTANPTTNTSNITATATMWVPELYSRHGMMPVQSSSSVLTGIAAGDDGLVHRGPSPTYSHYHTNSLVGQNPINIPRNNVNSSHWVPQADFWIPPGNVNANFVDAGPLWMDGARASSNGYTKISSNNSAWERYYPVAVANSTALRESPSQYNTDAYYNGGYATAKKGIAIPYQKQSGNNDYDSESGSFNDVYYNIPVNEPINYRRLLEKSATCNWRIIVDRIVVDNDQQASIFLQQKLKISNTEQRNLIIDCISEQLYNLMVNRFGNFLIQRCLEYSNKEQVERLTQAIEGNVCALSKDPFGCHVVQKALDCMDERMKHVVVDELLESVCETMVHRYACHVWQKLFELRWDNTPPQFMTRVNAELAGMWDRVALEETGSLVVQNIFENCTEEDKRPCVAEVIEKIDVVIRGQWGNWVIQHMIECATDPFREEVISIVIENSPAYSTDQYASKVVEKLLKMGDKTIIQRFLDKVVQRNGRPRIPLIDIASDAHGNYLIQYILQSGSPQQQDEVAGQIKKHMVSLRGSKWGSKCAWLIDRNRANTSVNAVSKTLLKDRKDFTKF